MESCNGILAAIMMLLVGFDCAFTMLWQHWAPGDANPVVDWMLRKLGLWTFAIILPFVGIALLLLGSLEWWGVTVVLVGLILGEAWVVVDEFRKGFAVIGKKE
jgi:hypothetical protein